MLKQGVLICAWSAAALADGAAEGERLFQDARELLARGAVAEACTVFEASYRADANLSTLVNLASCRERNGQLATAWAHYVTAANQTAGRSERARMHERARDRAAALEPRLSYLIINVPDASRIDGLVVARNGNAVDPVSWNRALPVDGGTYVVAGKAPGHEAWSTTVVVRGEADRKSVDVPRFHPLAEPAAIAPVVQDADPEEEAIALARPSSIRRPLAIGLGAAGVLAGIGAALLDASARDRHDQSAREVDDVRQRELHDAAITRRYGAQALGIAGVGAVAVGTVLFVLDRRDRQRSTVQATLSPRAIGIAWTGGF